MKTALQYWLDGYRAAEQGLSREACPLIWNAWPRMGWLKGYDFYVEFGILSHKPEPVVFERVPAKPTEQGRNAFRKGIAYQDCPYEQHSQDADNWLHGWHFERAMGEVFLSDIGGMEADEVPAWFLPGLVLLAGAAMAIGAYLWASMP